MDFADGCPPNLKQVTYLHSPVGGRYRLCNLGPRHLTNQTRKRNGAKYSMYAPYHHRIIPPPTLQALLPPTYTSSTSIRISSKENTQPIQRGSGSIGSLPHTTSNQQTFKCANSSPYGTDTAVTTTISELPFANVITP